MSTDWARQLSMMRSSSSSDEGFDDDYIWFPAETSDGATALREVGRDELRAAASFGAARTAQHAALATELARRWAEVQVARRERERDDAVDAVAMVSEQLIVAAKEVSEGERTLAARDAQVQRLRADCDALRQPRRWNQVARVGWPPRTATTTAKPAWVTRIAPRYTKSDFDEVRSTCRRFQDDVARPNHRPDAAALVPRLRPLAGSDVI